MCRPKGYDFCAFLVRKQAYTWSGIGYGFWGNYTDVWTYLSSQFQMNKKELEICEFEMHLKKFFCLHSNVSNYDIISA